MDNRRVAELLREIATLLELKGENRFRVRAYQRAAQNIEGLTFDIAAFPRGRNLESIPGVGKDLAAKIEEAVTTGGIAFLERLKQEFPPEVISFLDIPGLGPKTVRAIYERLAIDTMEKLEAAARKGELAALEGIKRKTEENIIKGIALLRKGRERTPLYDALAVGEYFFQALRKLPIVKQIAYAGSLRRRKDTVRDIDILVVSSRPQAVIKRFVSVSQVRSVSAQGSTKSSVLAGERNIQVDLRVVGRESFGSALMYFTGSKQFNIKMRQLALRKNYKINEYGIFSLGSRRTREKRIGGRTEEEIFKVMGMQPIPPELREDRGEIEASFENRLPELLTLKDIKGDFHVHSRYSDGEATIAQIAAAARKQGYSYIAICDHSQSLKVARGLDKKSVYEKLAEIKKINASLKGIRVLAGTEVDILPDGKIDYPDRILKEFDVVIASIHSGFKQSRAQLTSRIVSACHNRYVHIIGHPTGKLWGMREPYDIDFEAILRAARDTDTALEINCYPHRLDLNDTNALRAKEAGVKLAFGTDAHAISDLSMMDLGVSVARRGWLQASDVINCMSIARLARWLAR